MTNLILIGSGAVAAEICSYLKDINNVNKDKIVVKGFLDDSEENFKINSKNYGINQPYFGKAANYKIQKDDRFVFGYGSVSGKINTIKYIDKKYFINILHPTIQMAKTAKLGLGNVIYPFCVIGPNVQIGDFNLITSYSFISHDCVVGNKNFFSTTGLSGNVLVGDDNFFGIRTTILPSVKIGNSNIIQAGMVIDKNVTDNETVFYRYKEKISIINQCIK